MILTSRTSIGNEMLKTLHLFAGSGGGLLADIILGHEPVCAVEWDSYCCQILRERAAEGWFPGLHVFEGDVRVFKASDWKGRVDCIHAGFPCQPHSVAGKRKGADDDRNLWPECVRVIGEIRPQWVFLENVPGLVSNGFIGIVLNDLASLGYDARWTLLGADQVGAPHKRERWWLLAHSKHNKVSERWGEERGPMGVFQWDDRSSLSKKKESVLANTDRLGLERSQLQQTQPIFGNSIISWFIDKGWWKIEPDLGRVVDGIAYRVDRLKALGNGQVPMQAAIAWKILSQ